MLPGDVEVGAVLKSSKSSSTVPANPLFNEISVTLSDTTDPAPAAGEMLDAGTYNGCALIDVAGILDVDGRYVERCAAEVTSATEESAPCC